jgi:glycerol-3-phosphate dehydrogenase
MSSSIASPRTVEPPPTSVTRPAQLAQASLDLLVVGGGITGVGILLEATRRGLRAGLVEQYDVAAGTSSRSSCLVHGGLRYLEQFQFRLVRQALAERHRLLAIAPHLVRTERFLFPVSGRAWSRAFYGTGLTLYDLLGARMDGGRHRWLGRREMPALSPSVAVGRFRGAFVYTDAVMDDARLAVTVARTAVAEGGLLATRCRVLGPLEIEGRVAGAIVRDETTGTEHEIPARHVIDATGAWSAQSGHPFGAIPTGARPSRGVHLLLPRSRLKGSAGLTIRVPGRVVFVVPTAQHWIVGTTDIEDTRAPEDVAASSGEVEYLLETLNGVLATSLTRADLSGVYAGVRPLAVASAGSTVVASREHRVFTTNSGLVRISGGKYTTFRVMAADAVNASLGTRGAASSITGGLPGASLAGDLRLLPRQVAEEHRLDATLAAGLVERHGTEAIPIAALGRSLGLLEPLVPGRTELAVEVVWAVRHEFARSLEDVLERRVRLAGAVPDRAVSAVDRVSVLIASELGWDEAARDEAVRCYLTSAHGGHDVPERPQSGAPG